MVCIAKNARTHAYPALRAAQLGIIGGEQVGKLFPSRSYRFTEALPSCLSVWLHWQPAGLGWAGLGWLAGWLAAQRRLHSGWLAERITRPRGKARREQARLTLHALGVQPFPLPSRHAKQRQCRLIKQASSQVERWYRDYMVMMIKAHRTRESVVPLGSRVPPLRKPSRMFHRPMSATANDGT